MNLIALAVLVHLALLTPVWALSGDPLAFAVLCLWVAATSVEGVWTPSRLEHVPRFEALRAWALLAALWTSLATSGGGTALGMLAIIGGSALRWWSIRTLGDGFRAGVTPRGPLVDDGPYRLLAHPSELGLMVASLGVVMGCGSVWGAWAWGVLVVAPSVWRMKQESDVLRAIRSR